MLSLQTINSNSIYAPIGHEQEFNRRIFLDNFYRCMTIREFQKTAGYEIKKKVCETPIAKIMKEKNFNIDRIRKCNLTKDINDLWKTTQYDRVKTKYIDKKYHKYVLFKNGNVSIQKVKRFQEALEFYRHFANCFGNGNTDHQKIGTNLMNMGFNKFLDEIFLKSVKNIKPTYNLDYWLFKFTYEYN